MGIKGTPTRSQRLVRFARKVFSTTPYSCLSLQLSIRQQIPNYYLHDSAKPQASGSLTEVFTDKQTKEQEEPQDYLLSPLSQAPFEMLLAGSREERKEFRTCSSQSRQLLLDPNQVGSSLKVEILPQLKKDKGAIACVFFNPMVFTTVQAEDKSNSRYQRSALKSSSSF